MNHVTVAELGAEHLDEMTRLLTMYRTRDAKHEDHLTKECRHALERLLQFPNAFGLLARFDSHAAGFLTYNWGFSTSKGLPIMRIQDLFTAPLYRRLGVGSALLRRAAALAEEWGAGRMQLETDLDNAPARSLYAAEGFEWIAQKIVYMYPMQGWNS
ncbi:GNAT family N-acetyltransferase [Paenibacillus doosanensis]|uniref:GNAT family N-acetyltransferase n=1 Tax=Paenibacillus doosanensis TaxID=1229154 RepID=UPI00217F3476|nr:GNAT family N-acetyltransferase [Paenibacillus doosanensis]MCS7462767.1 GNAT family N-acetyltransferase [Paenibacillus doosanensis]